MEVVVAFTHEPATAGVRTVAHLLVVERKWVAEVVASVVVSPPLTEPITFIAIINFTFIFTVD